MPLKSSYDKKNKTFKKSMRKNPIRKIEIKSIDK